MLHIDERAARWFIQGRASGEPMTADKAAAVLNELFAADPGAADRLFKARVPCNEGVANHPTVVCRPTDGGHEVGILGVLNGILARDDPGGSGVVAVVDHFTQKLMGFEAVGFGD